MPKQVQIALPWPPSVNTYWRSIVINGAARVLISKAGRQYREDVGHQVYAQRIARNLLTGKLKVEIAACPPDRRARDLDNVLKSLLDSLKHAAVIRDDADIDDLSIKRNAIVKGGAVVVVISEIAGEPTHSGHLFAEDRAA